MLPLPRCHLLVVYHGCVDVLELLGQKEIAYRSKIVSTSLDRYWWVRAILVHMKISKCVFEERKKDGLLENNKRENN